MGTLGIKFKGNVQDKMKNKKHNLIWCCFLSHNSYLHFGKALLTSNSPVSILMTGWNTGGLNITLWNEKYKNKMLLKVNQARFKSRQSCITINYYGTIEESNLCSTVKPGQANPWGFHFWIYYLKFQIHPCILEQWIHMQRVS